MKTKNGIEIIRVLPSCNNVLLIKQGENYILVDSGLEKKWDNIIKKLDKLGFNNELDLKAIILTHAHVDHVGNAAKLKDRYRSRVIAHRNEIEDLNKGINGCKSKAYDPVDCEIIIDKVFDLNGFGINASIIYTPGHTMGSISIILENEIAITGDALPGKTWTSEFSPTGINPEMQIESSKILLDFGCRYYIRSHGKSYERDYFQRMYDEYINKKTGTK